MTKREKEIPEGSLASPRPLSAPGRGWLLGVGIAAIAIVAFVIWYFGSLRDLETFETAPGATTPLPAARFVGSVECARCHSNQYESWRQSQHAQAMQVASDDTVLGDFSGATFTHQGVTSEFFRRDGRFMVRTEGPGGSLADFEIQHTFGVYPLQQYLVELSGGHVQALSIAWDARPPQEGGQRWFHLYPNEQIDHADELHWTRRQQNWNYMCADCHSTHLRKNYDAGANTYSTSWSEISVGCEACHGPGSNHVALGKAAASQGTAMPDSGLTVDLGERRSAAWTIDQATGNAKRSKRRESDTEIEVCAQCHSRRGQFSDEYVPGDRFQDHYRPALLEDPLYFPDGQQRDEVYNWGSFLSSRMYSQGVTCGDCHDPHTQQLRAEGNAVCGQCHLASRFDTTEHYFHEPGTDGAKCKSCHMKAETYMVVDPRHDHSFRIPRPDLTTLYGVPNPCTDCHAKTAMKISADVAIEEIRKRYPTPRSGFQNFVDAFEAADRDDPAAAYPLLQVAADPRQSAIARASAFERLARQPSREGVVVANSALKDPDPLVRRAALEIVAQLPPLNRTAAIPLLTDPVRSVRMEAARTLAPLAADALGSAAEAYAHAEREYIAGEAFNADRPESRTNLGGFLAMRNRFDDSEQQYRAALKLDPRYVPAWTNLADLKRAQGHETESEQILRQALDAVPDSAALHHSLGLSLVRQQRNPEALVELQRSSDLEPDNVRFAYVLAIGQHSLGQAAAAIKTLEQALRLAPDNAELLSALATYHLDAGHHARALTYARKIVELYPDDPNAAALLESLQDPEPITD
jgi:tetratricopeptide (TPR) repeat protein